MLTITFTVLFNHEKCLFILYCSDANIAIEKLRIISILLLIGISDRIGIIPSSPIKVFKISGSRKNIVTID